MTGDTHGAVILGVAEPVPITAISTPCSVCGIAMLVPEEDFKEAMRLGAPIRHGYHGQENIEVVVNRRYEARVTVVRVEEDGTEIPMLGVTARGDAPTLQAAMNDALSGDLQTKWLKVIENAHLAEAGADE
jgi:hypothetical protein